MDFFQLFPDFYIFLYSNIHFFIFFPFFPILYIFYNLEISVEYSTLDLVWIFLFFCLDTCTFGSYILDLVWERLSRSLWTGFRF